MKSKLFYLLFIIFIYSSSSSAQEITMFSGWFGMEYYQDANKISKDKLESLMYEDNEANYLWTKSKKHLTIAWIGFASEVGFLTWAIIRARDNKSKMIPWIGALASAGVAIGYSFSTMSLRKKAILTYNQNQSVSTILDIGPTTNGLGLVYQF